MKDSAIVINNVRSVSNVASIFRTAAAVGVGKIFLVGLSPTPLDRFGQRRKDFAKISLGSEEFVAWEAVARFGHLARRLKKEKYFLIALEQAPRSCDYKKIKPKKKIAIVVGNEVKGLAESDLQKCSVTAEIKTPGKKESLNVATALAIALFRILDI